MRVLKEFRAEHSYTACFVNPNAFCPICGKNVFYYQNEFGSKVFFDELGHPWPKHECTDRRKRRTKPQVSIDSDVLEFRNTGAALELVAAQISADKDFDIFSYENENELGRAPLFTVDAAKKKGFQIKIRSISRTQQIGEIIYLFMNSEKIYPRTGDIFSYDGESASFFDFKNSTERELRASEISERDYESGTWSFSPTKDRK